MTASFTFVSVNLTKSNAQIRRRGAGIAAEDRVKIRSMAARNQGIRTSPSPVPTRGRKTTVQGQKKEPSETSEADCPGLSEDSVGEKSQCNDEIISLVFENENGQTCRSRRFASLCAVNNHEEEVRKFAKALSLRLPQHLKSDTLDPFWTLCIPPFPLVSELMDHRIKFLTPAIPELDIHVTGSLESRTTFHFFKAFTEVPCFMWSQLLYAAGHMRASIMGSSRFEDVTIYERQMLENEELVIWLKGCTLNAITRSFDKEQSEVQQDGRISAIMTLSAFEKCFGNPELYDSHIKGVRQLINQRGGMPRVNKVVRKLMAWLAGNTTTLSECYPDSKVYEIQQPLNEFAADVISDTDSPPDSIENMDLDACRDGLEKTFPTKKEAYIDNYPNSPFTPQMEDRFFTFARHLTTANIRGKAGDESPFILEQDSRGCVVARWRSP